MFKFLKNLFQRLFFKKPVHDEPTTYEIVEQTLSDGGVVSAIRLLVEPYSGVIVTISPKVEVREIEDNLHIIFDFNIVSNPTGKEIEYLDLKPFVGDTILEIMKKDYNAS